MSWRTSAGRRLSPPGIPTTPPTHTISRPPRTTERSRHARIRVCSGGQSRSRSDVPRVFGRGASAPLFLGRKETYDSFSGRSPMPLLLRVLPLLLGVWLATASLPELFRKSKEQFQLGSYAEGLKTRGAPGE